MEQIQNVIFNTVYLPAIKIAVIFAIFLIFRVIDVIGCRMIDHLFKK